MSAVPESDKAIVPGHPPRPSWETAARPPAATARPPAARPPAAAARPPIADAAPVIPPAAPVSPLDPAVRYDLSGNPISSSGAVSVAPPPAPFGYSAGNAPSGTWPPPPASSIGYGTAENGTDRVARLKWNWGAFLIPFWWSVFNGQRGLASVIALLNIAGRWIPAPFDWGVSLGSLGLMVYLGAMGHRLAWSSERFAGDYDSFIGTQRAWMIWGFLVTGLITGAIIAGAILLPGFLAGFTGGLTHTPRHQ